VKTEYPEFPGNMLYMFIKFEQHHIMASPFRQVRKMGMGWVEERGNSINPVRRSG
jgi:hypothetical protein